MFKSIEFKLKPKIGTPLSRPVNPIQLSVLIRIKLTGQLTYNK